MNIPHSAEKIEELVASMWENPSDREIKITIKQAMNWAYTAGVEASKKCVPEEVIQAQIKMPPSMNPDYLPDVVFCAQHSIIDAANAIREVTLKNMDSLITSEYELPHGII